MANTIGVDDKMGLRQTFRVYWQTKLAFVRAEYAGISGSGAAAAERRRAAAGQFAKLMRDRDTDLRNLGAIRRSMLALSEAHSAAARGYQSDALFWIGRVTSSLDDVNACAESAHASKKREQ